MEKVTIGEALEFIGVDPKDFNLTRGHFSRADYAINRKHGMQHLYRVMILCAQIARMINMPREGLLAFCGAFIHDLARMDNGRGEHHGTNAANEKFPLFENLWQKYELTEQERNWVRAAVAEHDGERGHGYEGCYVVKKILTDADALDRVRFYHHGRLNPDRLHFPESHELIAVDEDYCAHTREIEEVMNFMDFINLCEGRRSDQ